MNINDVLKHYGTQVAVADALSINQASIGKWVAKQAIPQLRQLQLEALTGGALKADSAILPRKTRKNSNKSAICN